MPDPLFAFVMDAPQPAVLELEMQVKLSVMQFLQFAIWGAWWVILANYLNTLGFSRIDIGRIYATQPWGTIIASMAVGTLADRFVPSAQLLGVLHLIGAFLLFALARVRTARSFFWVALIYAMCYAPTIALTVVVTTENVPSSIDSYPIIRVWGTIGWIVASASVFLLVRSGQPMNNRPLILAGLLSLAMGVYAFFLPVKPLDPLADAEIPFLKALALFRDPQFANFFVVSFLIAIALAFYYSFTPLFLEKAAGVASKNVGAMMSIGQWFEILFMLLLTWFIRELGIELVLMIGMLAWAVRFGLFSIQRPFALILIGVALHGICYDFFFAAGNIYVAENAPKDISNSGQALFAVLTYGLGMLIGSYASGWLNEMYTTESVNPATGEVEKRTDWRRFWLIPSAMAFLCVAGYFSVDNYLKGEERARPKVTATEPSAADPAPTSTVPTETLEAPSDL